MSEQRIPNCLLLSPRQRTPAINDVRERSYVLTQHGIFFPQIAQRGDKGATKAQKDGFDKNGAKTKCARILNFMYA